MQPKAPTTIPPSTKPPTKVLAVPGLPSPLYQHEKQLNLGRRKELDICKDQIKETQLCVSEGTSTIEKIKITS